MPVHGSRQYGRRVYQLHYFFPIPSRAIPTFDKIIKWSFLQGSLPLWNTTPPPSGHDVPMAMKSENPWSLDLSTSFTILFGIFGLGVSLLNLYFAWEQLDHVRV